MPFLSQIVGHPAKRIAIIDAEGEHSYGSLVQQARELAGVIRQRIQAPEDSCSSQERARIAFLAGHSASSAVTLLAIWLADAVAVPLDPLMSLPEWQWRLQELDVCMLVYAPQLQAEAHYLSHSAKVEIVSATEKSDDEVPLKIQDASRSALILFSNKVDSRPAPVVHTFSSLAAQTRTLVHSWHWQPEDRLLHVLPLSNHHGLVCALLGTMAAGCCCELTGTFKVDKVWQRLASSEVTLFTAVPAMYQYLLDAWEKQDQVQQEVWSSGAKHIRQAIVSPQPVPLPVRQQWEKITGRPMYFKYGMPECAMVLHCTLNGADYHGITGMPVPGVSLRLVDSSGHETDEALGELEVRSSQLFLEYFGNSSLTRKHFNHGWFRTGLLAVRNGKQFQLHGCRNLDLIETGGYRVSALDIESILLDYPGIRECAVLGVPCAHWGEMICAFIVPDNELSVMLPELKEWLTPLMPSYMVPARLEILQNLPRNTLGAIDKQLLKRELF